MRQRLYVVDCWPWGGCGGLFGRLEERGPTDEEESLSVKHPGECVVF